MNYHPTSRVASCFILTLLLLTTPATATPQITRTIHYSQDYFTGATGTTFLHHTAIITLTPSPQSAFSNGYTATEYIPAGISVLTKPDTATHINNKLTIHSTTSDSTTYKLKLPTLKDTKTYYTLSGTFTAGSITGTIPSNDLTLQPPPPSQQATPHKKDRPSLPTVTTIPKTPINAPEASSPPPAPDNTTPTPTISTSQPSLPATNQSGATTPPPSPANLSNSLNITSFKQSILSIPHIEKFILIISLLTIYILHYPIKLPAFPAFPSILSTPHISRPRPRIIASLRQKLKSKPPSSPPPSQTPHPPSSLSQIIPFTYETPPASEITTSRTRRPLNHRIRTLTHTIKTYLKNHLPQFRRHTNRQTIQIKYHPLTITINGTTYENNQPSKIPFPIHNETGTARQYEIITMRKEFIPSHTNFILPTKKTCHLTISFPVDTKYAYNGKILVKSYPSK